MEEEHATFLRYAETTKINSTLFDHTGSGDTHYAVRLNGSESERIGLARSLAVMTGDTIRAEVFAKYLDPDQNNWTAALHDLMAAVVGGTAPTGTVIEAVPPVGGDGFPFAGLLDAAKAEETGTQAYLNILLFDEGLGFLDAAFVPVSTAAREDGTGVPHERLAEEIIVQQRGYAYIYFSNDNDQPLEVFFDDFTVELAHSAIVQADDYYPFGMTFNEYRREDGMMNKYLYNGKELQQETGWYDFGARMYMPDLGRWMSPDPLADVQTSYSPYNYVLNNPVNLVDPDGLIWEDPKEAEKLKKSVQQVIDGLAKRKAKLEAKIEKREAAGKSTKNQTNAIGRIDARTDQLETTKSNIDALGADQDHVFRLASGDNQGDGKHGVTQGSDGVINIYGTNNALHVHEIRHVALSLDSENGLEFNSNNSLRPTTPTGRLDEIEGYKAQYGYSGRGPGAAGSDDGIVENIANLKDGRGNYVYPAIRQYYLNRQQGIRNSERYQKKIQKGKSVKFKQ